MVDERRDRMEFNDNEYLNWMVISLTVDGHIAYYMSNYESAVEKYHKEVQRHKEINNERWNLDEDPRMGFNENVYLAEINMHTEIQKGKTTVIKGE